MGLLDQLAKGLGGNEGQGPQAAQLSGLAEAVMGMLRDPRSEIGGNLLRSLLK